MKANSLIAFVFTLAFAASFFVTGCKSTPKVDWNTRIGSYTFDQAVTELGPPDKSAKLTDGKTVADWIRHRRGGLSFGLGTGYAAGGTGVDVGAATGTGYNNNVLELTFGPDNKLVSWDRNH